MYQKEDFLMCLLWNANSFPEELSFNKDYIVMLATEICRRYENKQVLSGKSMSGSL